jgi:hypothetical protein
MKKIAFTLVLNGMPFIEKQFDVLPRVFDEWHIIEGATLPVKDTSWCKQINSQFLNDNYTSNDGTSEFLNKIANNTNIFVHRKNGLWNGKLEMCQQINHLLSGNIIMQIDVDEFWTISTLLEVLSYAEQMNEADGMLFKCNYFVGKDLITIGDNCYGNNPNEWCRLWKPKPNAQWLSHEPPRIKGCINFLSRECTLDKNWVFDHYAYTLEKQLVFKENFYGYANATKHWKSLQLEQANNFPSKLNRWLPWVDGKVMVTKVKQSCEKIEPLSDRDKAIVISHYSTNLDWTKNLHIEPIIYSKTIKTLDGYIDLNKGQEVPAYLKFIIDRYDTLPKKTLFYHDHLISPHQDFNSIFLINNLNWEVGDYFSVNKRSWYQTIDSNSTVEPNGIRWVTDNWDLFDNYLRKPTSLTFFSGAQFVVDAELILQYSKDFYQELYNWILTTDTSTYITSRIFEYIWHYIFTKNSIEPYYKTVIK